MWASLKAELLEIGTACLTGTDASEYITQSSSGPGAGGMGSVFFSNGKQRVKLNLSETSPVLLTHQKLGKTTLTLDSKTYEGFLEKPGMHCPNQAFLTVSASCIYSCSYCSVPKLRGKRKSIAEIKSLISQAGTIKAVSLTSGVASSPEEEETYILSVLDALRPFFHPVGVEIYPLIGTAEKLYKAGVSEVKFNLETATDDLFEKHCPGLNRACIFDELKSAAALFGKGHVYTNVIYGLGETDEEIRTLLAELAEIGVIASLRPLSPKSGVSGMNRPTKERMLRLFNIQSEIHTAYNLDTRCAQTMCGFCTGCDLVPGCDDE